MSAVFIFLCARTALVEGLRSGEPSAAKIAARLKISVRSLNRGKRLSRSVVIRMTLIDVNVLAYGCRTGSPPHKEMQTIVQEKHPARLAPWASQSCAPHRGPGAFFSLLLRRFFGSFLVGSSAGEDTCQTIVPFVTRILK